MCTYTFSKKRLQKEVKPGTWVKVDWDDVQDVTCLVVELEDGGFRNKGEVDLKVFDPRAGTLCAIDHTQIAAIGDNRLHFPAVGFHYATGLIDVR